MTDDGAPPPSPSNHCEVRLSEDIQLPCGEAWLSEEDTTVLINTDDSYTQPIDHNIRRVIFDLQREWWWCNGSGGGNMVVVVVVWWWWWSGRGGGGSCGVVVKWWWSGDGGGGMVEVVVGVMVMVVVVVEW
ncbi:hypothetical protein RHGRI_007237 [Rhododendron griersonianum]|uniref:Uncharacterized protein n=1 Tax=Rhododendron griersonianum TaxID=479676 RepID=A0AAV6KXY5_9ERIC|nr:hypothetical protein RHGRI_007237 [Rhododendron griersonianum]